MAKIKVEGIDDLQKAIKDRLNLDDVKRVVKHNGAELQRKAQTNADFKGHYEWEKGKGEVFKKPTGTLKRSIKYRSTNGGFTAEVEPEAEYAGYVELGTRFMEAQPYLKPAYDEQKKEFEADMKKLTK